MSELGEYRPRRAAAADETLDSDDLIGVDDTAADEAAPARRGGAEEVADDGALNPFARPGSDSAAQPVLPPRDFEDPTETTMGGRRMGPIADGPAPAPRRSAVSSTTPPDVLVPPPAAQSGGHSWLDHHRRTLLLWAVGTVVAAIVIATVVFSIRRAATPEVTTPPTSPTATTGTTSAAPLPDISEADLLTVADAEAVVPGAGWVVTKTATTKTEATSRAACLTADKDNVNPTVSLQRTIGTSGSDQLAVLHQVQSFADEAVAIEVQKARVAELAACNLVPARIISSSAVTGLANDVAQVTVAYEEKPAQFHTVMLLRTGRVLTVLDVARNASAVGVTEAIAGLKRSLAEFCTRTQGTCPAAPKAVTAPPPATQPSGWLATADLPRLRAGFGQWTATDPADISSVATGCENLTLATVGGPKSRAQRTYLLTQDNTTPTTFGVDEMLFTFAAPAEAGTFVGTLGKNIAECKKRMLTATVTEGKAAGATMPDGTKVSSRIFTVKQAVSASSSLTYQIVLSVTGKYVTYTVATVTPEYQFSAQQLAELAIRSPQRAAQAGA